MAAKRGPYTKDKSEKISFRVDPDVLEVIRHVAEDNDRTVSDVIRAVIDNRLLKYLDMVVYVDPEDAKEIRQILQTASDDISAIGLELNRIGVNYNQEIKLRNELRKYPDRQSQAEAQKRFMDEAGQKYFSKDEVEKLMSQFNSAADKLGKALLAVKSGRE